MIDVFTEEKKAALLELRGKILNQLLSGTIKSNGTEFDFEYPLVSRHGIYDPLSGFHTVYHYDRSQLSINEIRDYLADFGMIIVNEDFPKVIFDFDFIANYQPQTKLVTTKFLWHTRHELVGLTSKDRIKLYIKSLYPSFSDEALRTYVKRDGYKSNGKRMLLVKPSDIRFQAVRRFAINHDAELTDGTLSIPSDNEYLIIRFNYGLQ